MPQRRPRRIVSRAAIALAGIVLLVGGYVSGYFGAVALKGHGVIPQSISLLPVFSPLRRFEVSALPGSERFFTVRLWFQLGGASSFDDCRRLAMTIRWHEHERKENNRIVF
jgi:hypothetical protein